jgi:hypothetical protein
MTTSNKFFHNFHLSKSSFTCPRLQASGLARRLLLFKFPDWKNNWFQHALWKITFGWPIWSCHSRYIRLTNLKLKYGWYITKNKYYLYELFPYKQDSINNIVTPTHYLYVYIQVTLVILKYVQFVNYNVWKL